MKESNCSLFTYQDCIISVLQVSDKRRKCWFCQLVQNKQNLSPGLSARKMKVFFSNSRCCKHLHLR